MKTVSVRDLQKSVRECVDAAQSERVVVTRRGKPAAVLIGVEGKDWETVVLETSPAFWKLMEERRKQPTIPLAKVRRRLDSPAPRSSAPGRSARSRKPRAGG
ncbi:MAG: type II toxin-antitoxin system Phd/YefM family antitoxin [Candidatus Acidiferrales bacterium]